MTSTSRRVGTGIVAAAGLLAVATLLARVIGFGRWLVFSGSVGTTCVGEVYQSANLLPNVLYEVAAGGALAAVAVPLIARQVGAGDREAADRTASALLTWALTILVPMSVLLALLARPLSAALLGRQACSNGPAVDLGAQMITVFAPQVALYGVGIVLAGILQAHRRFLAIAIAPLLSSIVVIAAYLAYARLAGQGGGDPSTLPASAAYTLSAGTTLGVVALSLPLLLPVRRAGIRFRATWRFPIGLGRRAAGLAAAGVLALVAQQVAVLVTLWVSNHQGGVGTVNVYTYVQAVYLLPYAVLAVPVAMSTFPTLAAGVDEVGDVEVGTVGGAGTVGGVRTVGRASNVGDANDPAPGGAPDLLDRTAQMLARSSRVVVAAGCLGAAVLVATAVPIGGFFASLDAGRANPAGRATLGAMPGALLAYAPGLVGFGLAALLTRAMYVRGRPSVAAAAVALGWLVAALVPLLVLHGQPGAGSVLRVLGASSSVGMTLAAVGLLVAVHRAWGRAALAGLAHTTVTALAAATAAGFVGWLLGRAVPHGGLATAVGAGAVAAAVALAIFGAVMMVGDHSSAQLVWRRVGRRAT